MSRCRPLLRVIGFGVVVLWLVLLALAQVPVAPTNVTVNAQLQPPSILGLSTSAGLVGATVIVHGANFGQIQGSSTVRFNGTLATVTVWSIDTLTTTVPAGATTGTVVVTVAGLASNGSAFTVLVPPPTVTITVPTASPTYDAGTASALTVSGTASTAGSLTGCTWVNSLGGSGSTTGTTNWSISSVTLTVGTNTVTVTCTDAQSQTGNDGIAITRSAGGPVTNPIAAARLPGTTVTLPNPTFSTAGAGTIPTRVRCTTGTGTSVLAAGSTVAQINTAIAGCDAFHRVEVTTGTYNLSSGIDFGSKDHVTLWGPGPNLTHFVFSGGVSCSGLTTDVCFKGTDVPNGEAPQHVATISSGYTQGSTQLTLSSTTGLIVGSLLLFDQTNDANIDTGTIWVNSTLNVSSSEDSAGATRVGTPLREQNQTVTVTAIAGSVVTISSPVYMPNWASGRTPQAWWAGAAPITDSGIEGIDLNHAGSSGASGIIFIAASSCWVKNVSSYMPGRNHVWVFESARITVRDSYFDEGQAHASQAYGVEPFYSADLLVENNIFHHVTAPLLVNGSASGSVYAYNYSLDNTYTASAGWMISEVGLHSAGIDMQLFEGNTGNAFQSDVVHGTHHFVTAFRNYWLGQEAGKSAQTSAIIVSAYGRYLNLVGNVLGTSGFHSVYECAPTLVTTAACASNANVAIYALGWSGVNGEIGAFNNDVLTKTTLFRWGNYDVVNGTRFVAGEVPSGLAQYANPVPGSQTLPSSLYLASKPAFFTTHTWPPVGPDVTGGDVSNVGGHVFKIPAQLCYEAGAKDGTGKLTAFTATGCY